MFIKLYVLGGGEERNRRRGRREKGRGEGRTVEEIPKNLATVNYFTYVII